MRQFRYMLLPTGATLADAEERWHNFLNFGGAEPPDLASAIPFVPENWMEATKSIQQLREMAKEAVLTREGKEGGIVEGTQGQGQDRTEVKRLGDESEEMERLNKAWQRRQKVMALGKRLSSARQLEQTQERVNSNADGTKEQAEKRGVIGAAMLYEDAKESNRAGFMEFVAQVKQKGLDSLAEAEKSLQEGGAAEDILDTPATSTKDAEIPPPVETMVRDLEEKGSHPETSLLQDKASSSSDNQTSSSSDTSSTVHHATTTAESTHSDVVSSDSISASSDEEPLSATVMEKEPSEVIEEVDGEDVPLSDSRVTDREPLQSPVVEKADDQEPPRTESPQVATASPTSPASSSVSPTPESKEGSS